MKNNKFIQVFFYLIAIACIYFIIETILTNRLMTEYDSVCRQFGEYSTIIIRNDDISALSNLDHEKRIFSIFLKYNIPQVIGVIPYVSENCSTCIDQKFYHISLAPEIISYFSELKKNGILEIGQHGYQHCSNYLHEMGYNGLSEFSDLLYSEQFEKISSGKAILESTFNQEIDIFLPPYNRYDDVTVNVLDDLGFTILSGGSGIINSQTMSIINRNASFSELRAYLALRENDLPPYFFIMYHSYEIKNDHDFVLLDSTLMIARNNPKIKFSTLSNFNRQFHEQIRAIELLNVRLKEHLYKKWYCFYFVNNLTDRISDFSFLEIDKSLRFHDIKLLQKVSANIVISSTVNLLLESIMITFGFSIVLFVHSRLRGLSRSKVFVFTSILVLLVKVIETSFILVKFGQIHLCLSHAIFLITTVFCFFIYCSFFFKSIF